MKDRNNSQKILLVAGCSHSCGCEIQGPGIYQSQYNIDNSFGGILSKTLDLKHVNIAITGCSNKFIISNVIHHVNLLSNEFQPTDIITLVGWTAFARLEAVLDDRLYHFSINADQHPEWTMRPKELVDYHRTWSKFFNTQIFNNEHLVNYTLLKSFLETKGVNYFFFNAVNSVEQANKDYFHVHDRENIDLVGYKSLKNDPKYYFPFDKTFYNIMKKKFNPCLDGRYHHFGKDAHEEWAEILKPYIQQYL